jgi:nickel-dependent lactate racemase
MKPEIEKAVRQANPEGWPKVELDFGADVLEIRVPPGCATLSMNDVAVLHDPRSSIDQALAAPIGSPTIKDIVRNKMKPASEITAAVAVSDVTRPVPYLGENGLLAPVLRRLEDAGVRKQNIKIVVGTGTHRPSTADEKAAMFGESVARDYHFVDHACEQMERLKHVGKTRKGTEVYVNGEFMEADVKIVTGLVESHFMAGVSGGRKGVCPALVDIRTIEKFHGPEFLESPAADNLILEGNPCHEEALDVAKTVGVDFTVNVTLDKNMRLTGVFAGHLEEAHLRAFRFMKGYTAIPLSRDYDIVLTHGGYAGRNHYQTAKAGCGALPAVKRGGAVIIAADNRDREPVGSPEYRDLLRRLKTLGIEGYLKMIQDPSWTFTKDQWEPEVWGRVLRKVGETGLYYCSPQISAEDYSLVPCRSGLDFLEKNNASSGPEAARAMVQNSLFYAVARYREKGESPSVAVLREGPYGIPCLQNK